MKRFTVVLDDWKYPDGFPRLTIHVRANNKNAIHRDLKYYLTDWQIKKINKHFRNSILLKNLHIVEVK